MPDTPCVVGVAKWAEQDGVAQDICHELLIQGHHVIPFVVGTAVPRDADIVLTFAPWGRFLKVAGDTAAVHAPRQPTLVHWNLENPADIAIPWPFLHGLSAARSWVDRLSDDEGRLGRMLLTKTPLRWVDTRMYKFRYLGEYYYAYQKGWMRALAETSQLLARFHTSHGLPSFYVPWGTAPSFFDTLHMDRDIDVLWIGKRRTRRRSRHIDRVRTELASRGVNMFVADGVENPLVYGDARTRLINRSKITVNIMSTWYDNSFHMRFHMVAGNRSMVISEHIPPHYTEYKPGVHYVSTDLDSLSDAILMHLDHANERQAIAENAFRLVTTEMTFAHSVRKLMKLAQTVRNCEHDLLALADASNRP